MHAFRPGRAECSRQASSQLRKQPRPLPAAVRGRRQTAERAASDAQRRQQPNRKLKKMIVRAKGRGSAVLHGTANYVPNTCF